MGRQQTTALVAQAHGISITQNVLLNVRPITFMLIQLQIHAIVINYSIYILFLNTFYLECDPTCYTCTGGQIDECTSCTGSLYLYQSKCEACPLLLYYPNTATNTCLGKKTRSLTNSNFLFR